MAKSKQAKSAPKLDITYKDLIADLESKGGEHSPWYEVVGATYGSVRNAALKHGVEITLSGGLRLTGKDS